LGPESMMLKIPVL